MDYNCKNYNCSICTHEKHIPSCEDCGYNIGIEDSASRIAGPCGQQNCWYGCTVCEYNGGCNYTTD